MKKNIIMIAIIHVVCLQGMEQNFLSLKLYDTVITLYKGSLLEADGKVDLIVVGRNQQQKLQSPIFKWPEHKIRQHNSVYEQYTEDESASDSDTYKPFFIDKQKIWKKSYKQNMSSKVLTITEPMMGLVKDDAEATINAFCFNKKNVREAHSCALCIPEVYSDDQGLTHAAIDLASCYEIALYEGLKIIGKKDNKSIAIPTLSTEVGIARRTAAIAAVKGIVGFIQKNPGAYAHIKLYMKKKFELDWYDILFAQKALETRVEI